MRTQLVSIETPTAPLDGAYHVPEDKPVRGGVLLTGVNLPMLMRACCYRELPLAQRAQKALEGGQQGLMQIES